MAGEQKDAGVIERVDTFIRQLQDLDFVRTPIHDTDCELARDLARYLSDYLALDVNSTFRKRPGHSLPEMDKPNYGRGNRKGGRGNTPPTPTNERGTREAHPGESKP